MQEWLKRTTDVDFRSDQVSVLSSFICCLVGIKSVPVGPKEWQPVVSPSNTAAARLQSTTVTIKRTLPRETVNRKQCCIRGSSMPSECDSPCHSSNNTVTLSASRLAPYTTAIRALHTRVKHHRQNARLPVLKILYSYWLYNKLGVKLYKGVLKKTRVRVALLELFKTAWCVG
jgi:hypothetical protein